MLSSGYQLYLSFGNVGYYENLVFSLLKFLRSHTWYEALYYKKKFNRKIK